MDEWQWWLENNLRTCRACYQNPHSILFVCFWQAEAYLFKWNFNENQPKEDRKNIFRYFFQLKWFLNHWQIYSSVYPEVNYFHKFEDHVSLKNVKYKIFILILSLKTMMDRTLFSDHFPPLPHEDFFFCLLYWVQCPVCNFHC